MAQNRHSSLRAFRLRWRGLEFVGRSVIDLAGIEVNPSEFLENARQAFAHLIPVERVQEIGMEEIMADMRLEWNQDWPIGKLGNHTGK